MSRTLNTGHALYTNILSFIMVDGGALADIKVPSRTFTKHANASYGSGALGEHLRTAASGAYTPYGASMSPAVSINSGATAMTVMVIGNAFSNNGTAGGLYALQAQPAYTPTGSVSGNVAALRDGFVGNTGSGESTVTVVGNGMHSITTTRPIGDSPTLEMFVDGVSAKTLAAGYANANAGFDYIGGDPGQGAAIFDMVYVIAFNKVLTQAEISAIHTSLAAGNSISLLSAAAATAPGAPTIGAATAGVGSATVAFTAPASNGGSAITSYLGTASTGETASNASSPISFPTLSANIARTFHVQAVNAIGTGTASAESNSVTPTAANAAPTFSGTVANITGTGGVAITPLDVSSLFTDSGDTKAYSASPAGNAWPSGLVINASTGVISGTVATSTTTGLKVRDTDSANQTIDSNAFSVTIAAPASTVTGIAVLPSTPTVVGGSTQVFSATVNGTGSPSQAVNWSVNGGGSITSGGVLTAPATTSAVQTLTVTATSAQDGTKSGTAIVTVPATASVTVTIAEQFKHTQGGLPMASVPCHVAFYDKATDALLARKTGLTTSATGYLAPFTVTGLTANVNVRAVFVTDADANEFGGFRVTPT